MTLWDKNPTKNEGKTRVEWFSSERRDTILGLWKMFDRQSAVAQYGSGLFTLYHLDIAKVSAVDCL